MSIATSEYRIQIFISSTDFNLKDLRAETSLYLNNLGYRSILSSSEGFHDSSPELEPWESCLEVLGTCPIMILIIDNKYGVPFEWKNFRKEIEDRTVSPTHAEYLFSHYHKKRILVFIREEILAHYQSYRTTLKTVGGNKDAAKEKLQGVIPPYIDFEVFQFIEEVKMTRPIPWIRSFRNVTDVKTEIHKKLLNELAVTFLIKEKHIESVTSALSRILENATAVEANEILQKVGYAKEILTTYAQQNEIIKDLKQSVQRDKEEAAQLSAQLEKAKNAQDKNEEQIKELKEKLKIKGNELLQSEDKIIRLRERNLAYLLPTDTGIFNLDLSPTATLKVDSNNFVITDPDSFGRPVSIKDLLPTDEEIKIVSGDDNN